MTESNIELSAESFTVHAREQISTGEYESYHASATVEGSIDSVGGLSNGQRKALKARLLAVEKDLQAVVERSCANRIAADGHADWGVRSGENE